VPAKRARQAKSAVFDRGDMGLASVDIRRMLSV